MGIFDALTTSVAGLQAQSFALQNISGNVANSETTGYKETDTSFEDMVSSASQNQTTANGVIANSVATNTVAGTLQSSTVSTNMAINGDGWFVVAQPTGEVDNQPTFSGVSDYTRAGDFQLNSNGNLVNGAGYYLQGIPIDAATGNPVGSSPQILQFTNDFVPAQATTAIQYQANLPSTPSSGLLVGTDFEANPLAGAPAAAAITGSGATLQPDAVATLTGNVNLTTATTLASLGINANDQITVNDGTNTPTTYTVPAGPPAPTVNDLITAINAANAGNTLNVTAKLSGGASGDLVLTGSNGTASVTVTATGTDGTVLGLPPGSNSAEPVNLLTQGAVAQGDTMTLTVGNTAPQIITFGTGPGQVATLAELQTAIGAIGGLTGTVNTANGDITLTSNNNISLDSTPTALLSEFGIQNDAAYPANDTVIANDETTFTNQSVDGGSITAYDSEGNPVNVQFRWAESSAGSWQLFYQSDSNATGTEAAWQNVGTVFNFNSSGELSPPLSSVTLQNLTVNGGNLGNIQLNFGTNGLTQFANSSGTPQVSQLQQNGFAAGQLESIAVDGQNQITGTFSNGQTIPLAQITLATFNGPDALQPLDGEAYAATADSGAAILDATGTVEGSELEASNVDIATQFSQLIVAQQAYSANAKVMQTADQMIQSLLQVIQ
ncbi:MAG: flagellar hook-basal body complex protein [Xanthobacteraceae bacterium]